MIETLDGVGYRFREALASDPGVGRAARRIANELGEPQRSLEKVVVALAHALAEAKHRSAFFLVLTRRIVTLNLGGLIALKIGFFSLTSSAPTSSRRGLRACRRSRNRSPPRSRFGRGGNGTPSRSPRKAFAERAGQRRRARAERRGYHRILDQSGTGRAVLHRLVTPTHNRARIYDRDGLCSRFPDPQRARRDPRTELNVAASEDLSWLQRSWAAVRSFFSPAKAPRGVGNWAANGKSIPEVADALGGKVASIARVNSSGETIVPVGRAG